MTSTPIHSLFPRQESPASRIPGNHREVPLGRTTPIGFRIEANALLQSHVKGIADPLELSIRAVTLLNRMRKVLNGLTHISGFDGVIATNMVSLTKTAVVPSTVVTQHLFTTLVAVDRIAEALDCRMEGRLPMSLGVAM